MKKTKKIFVTSKIRLVGFLCVLFTGYIEDDAQTGSVRMDVMILLPVAAIGLS